MIKKQKLKNKTKETQYNKQQTKPTTARTARHVQETNKGTYKCQIEQLSQCLVMELEK